jgi:hypothetical protein
MLARFCQNAHQGKGVGVDEYEYAQDCPGAR